MSTTWGTIIPLIGGMAIGNKAAFGSDAKWAVGYNGFERNNEHFRAYFKDVPFHDFVDDGNITDLSHLEPVDVVSTVCPCAGLSMLNRANNKDSDRSRGCNALQNGYMYLTAEAVLQHLTPRVFFGENAPGLFTNAGYDVRVNLYEIAKKYGYSLSFVKTNTMLHGIPQHRMRTFYFFWDSDTAPIMNYYREKSPRLVDYLAEVPSDASCQYHMTPNLSDHITFRYIKMKEGNNWRKALLNNGRSVWGYIEAHNLFEDFIKFCTKDGSKQALKYIKRAVYIADKIKIDPVTGRSKGGYWDDSIIYYGEEEINGVIVKNVTYGMHPTEERSFTIRELLWMMGHPHDFEMKNKHIGTIFQNVPSCTAESWSREVVKYLNDELPFSKNDYLKQDNIKRRIV